MSSACPLIYFNSTMVRLKEKYLLQRVEYERFQFHYGTIKSTRPASTALARFYFNSTMVRLKVIRMFMSVVAPIAFQFHYGTIKSVLYVRVGSSVVYFNSTMVRLKERGDKEPRFLYINFNSTMVRLKASH